MYGLLRTHANNSDASTYSDTALLPTDDDECLILANGDTGDSVAVGIMTQKSLSPTSPTHSTTPPPAHSSNSTKTNTSVHVLPISTSNNSPPINSDHVTLCSPLQLYSTANELIILRNFCSTSRPANM